MKSISKILLTAVTICLLSLNYLYAEEFIVKNQDEIKKAAKKAQPGDVIIMADGEWRDAVIIFEAEGSEGKPVTLKAATPGKVILCGNSRLRMAGTYLVIDGLYFRDGFVQQESGRGRIDLIEFRTGSKKTASYCRLTNTVVENYNPPADTIDYKWISLYGSNNRVDHCSFSGKNHQGATFVVWLSEQPNYHQIDSNYFGPRPELGRNGGETIRIGTSDWSMHFSNTAVLYNYFYQCSGEREIISNKSFGNMYMHNTFVECQGTLTLRHGNQCLVEGNYFFGNGAKGTGGVRIIGEDHKVINNYFSGLTGDDVFAALAIMNGVPNSPLNRYFQVKNAFVGFNTFVNNKYNIVIGTGKDGELSLSPKDCIFANNVIYGTENPAVTLISQPENFKWEGNVFSVSETGLQAADGISLTDAKLVKSSDGLFRPSADSPLRGSAAGTYDFVYCDIDGHPRRENKDIGCDQVSEAPVLTKPMTKSDTGPRWKMSGSSFILFDQKKLSSLRTGLLQKENISVLRKLKKEAGKVLELSPVSVMDKKQVPPSGSKHDYMSMGKYWFPDPSKPDGKPYIRKDGQVNPESLELTDHDNFALLGRGVRTLAVAYYVTGEEKYAEHAARLLKVWFLVPETRMNPNMNYAQGVPGIAEGRGFGIIDIHFLPELLDAVNLLKGSKAWTKENNDGMNKWLSEYYTWLKTSKNGLDEAGAENNHGTWYEFQLASIAFYLGNRDEAKEVLIKKVMPRVAQQIEPDGKQPQELARTRALSYSMFNIQALTYIGIIGERLEVDLWKYSTPDGRGLKKAVDYVMPYLAEEKKWEHQQILELKPGEFYPLIKVLSEKYPDDQLMKNYVSKFSDDNKSVRVELLY